MSAVSSEPVAGVAVPDTEPVPVLLVRQRPWTLEMTKLRREMHCQMLGNGYWVRPVEVDCHFESLCESCTVCVTTIEPT